MKYKLGDNYFEYFSFTQENVNEFAKLTGDINPIHYDEDFAKQTIFKKPIIHGFLGASIFSNIIGTKFPGEGSIYLKQELSFKKPMFTGVKYKAIIELMEISLEKSSLYLETRVIDMNDVVMIKGHALIINKRIFQNG